MQHSRFLFLQPLVKVYADLKFNVWEVLSFKEPLNYHGGDPFLARENQWPKN